MLPINPLRLFTTGPEYHLSDPLDDQGGMCGIHCDEGEASFDEGATNHFLTAEDATIPICPICLHRFNHAAMDSDDYAIRAVPMRAVGKARPRVTNKRRKDGSRITFMPDSYQAARDELLLSFGPIVAPPVKVRVKVIRAMPQSWSKKKRAEMCGRWTEAGADADNVLGWVMDTLYKENDAGVVSTHAWKVWGEQDYVIIELWGIR